MDTCVLPYLLEYFNRFKKKIIRLGIIYKELGVKLEVAVTEKFKAK